MTASIRLAVRSPRRGSQSLIGTVLAAALAFALAAWLAACGPEPAEIDRSPVAGLTDENPDAGNIGDGALPEGARNLGTLALAGGLTYEGAAAVDCGPLAPSDGGGHGAGQAHGAQVGGEQGAAEGIATGETAGVAAGETAGQEAGGLGRVEPVAEDEPPGTEDETTHHGRAYQVTLTPVEAPGLAVTLRLGERGSTTSVPVVVAVVGEDGAYRESAGTAELSVEDGSLLTRSAATGYLSGRFTGRYAGEAGAGDLSGEFSRCFYFE